MSQNIIRLFTMLKAVVACEHYQNLTDDATELIQYDNNNRKVKYDYLKKLNILNI